jgi:hypothetical protein
MNTIDAINTELERLTDELVRAQADHDAEALRVLAGLSWSAGAAADLRAVQAQREARLGLRVEAIAKLEAAVRALREARAALVEPAAAPPLPPLSAGLLRELRAHAQAMDAALRCFHLEGAA